MVAAFGFFCAGAGSAAAGHRSPRCPVSLSVVLVAFVLMIHRRDVASQAIGLFSLENGISLAALVVAASLPLILEVALLFDLLLAVVVFGLLIRLHHGRADTLSTADLTRCGAEPMTVAVTLLLILPLAAGGGLRSPARRPRSSRSADHRSRGGACFGLVLVLIPVAAHHDLNVLGFLRVDALSVIFLIATTFLYASREPSTPSATFGTRSWRPLRAAVLRG